MKKLIIVLLFSLPAFVAVAQEDAMFSSGRQKHDTKPQLFSTLPSKFSLKTGLIDEIMNTKLNQQVSLLVTEGFTFYGRVISKTSDAPGLETVTIESTEKQGFVFTLSKTNVAGEGVIYKGLLLSRNHSDIILLEKNLVTGVYEWIKKYLSQMISD